MWSPQFRLLMWNQNYCELYGFEPHHLHAGMALQSVVDLSSRIGNHPEQTSRDFYEAYSAELLANREGARLKSQEVARGGRIIETAHVFNPALGWVVTHEDVTEEIASTEAIQKRKLELERQNLRLDAAVNNISQGLCMCDPRGRLVICNEPYVRIYNLPDRLVSPGTQLEDILEYLFECGMTSGGTRDDYIAWRRDVIASGQYGKTVHQFNGRTIMMQHHPMKDGGWVSTHEDITEQRQIEARIRYLARHDALTDLPNRVQFLEEMAHVEAAIARGEQVAVLYIDLDHFKRVNDTLGHAVGDELIRQAGVRLWGATRENDLLARLGGDEFALLLRPIASEADVAKVADRIVKAVAAPFRIGQHQIDISASVGVAMAPHDGTDTDTLVKKADMALYKAKAEGRSTFHFFETGMDEELQQRRHIEAGLRAALARDELRLVFQPLLDLGQNKVGCVEALLRWDSADGPISPAQFIPIAEEAGLIVPIGEWVLRQACRTAVAWPDEVRVAVNLSTVQFRNKDLVSVIRSALADAGLPARRLELEITESLLLADNEATLRALHQLRAMGVRISMDDFGIGYSSLSYLRSFPFDKIKIDRSFMRDLTTRSGNLAIIRAVIGLGQSLGMTTTAEGVETAEQMELVRNLGCSEVQGFLFSPPLPPEALAQLLASRSWAPRALQKAS
ncbi:MAG: hypothetical protein JWR39_2615 [Devosia sp.]|nr:hypothetical protein [Devosia sp.]